MHRARRTTLEIIDFAPSRVDQPTARVYYKTGTVQTIPLHAESERPTRLWQTDIERISVPPGCGLQGLDAGDRRTTFERGVNETCAGGICEGLTMASFMCFAALAVHQIVQLDPKEEWVVKIPSQHRWQRDEVTLVTQFSMSRFDRVLSLLETYQGPVSLAIYFTDPEDAVILQSRLREPDTRDAIAKHSLALLKPSYHADDIVSRLRYPINRLRNLALAVAPTQYVLVTDADFVPSANLARSLSQRAVALLGTPNPTSIRRAIVISAFQAHSPHLPQSAIELKHALANRSITLTDKNAGHGPSAPDLLFALSPTQATPSDPAPSSWSYEVAYEPQWEPYYVLHRPSHPLYDERFTDQGGDKQSHALLLNALGFSFQVLRDAWLVHPPRSTFEESESEWPSARLLNRFAADDAATNDIDHERAPTDKRHFSVAQTDKARFRYFEHFLPEMESRFGANVRWPRGASARVVGARRAVGRLKGEAVFGL